MRPEGLDKVFFTNGGADAIENAVRMARLHTGRHKVLTTYRSYHGDTATAIQMTGDPRRWANDRGSAGIVHFFGPVPLPLAVPRHRPRPRSASARSRTSSRSSRSRAGHRSPRSCSRPSSARRASSCPPDGYLAGVRELCDRHGIVLIADEVMAGFGRAGEWFAVDHWDVRPT